MKGNDDPVQNILPRPEAAAEHDRFFEDGEEPPARYDLPDPIDYIEVNPEPIDSARWRQIGWKFGWSRYGRSFLHSLAFYSLSLLVFLLGCLPLFAVLSPTLYGEVTLHSLLRLTGNRRFGPLRAWRHWVDLCIAYIPVFASQVATISGVIALGALVSPTVSHFHAEIYYTGGAGNLYPLPKDWPLAPAYILAGFALTWVHAGIVVRIGGFTTHLILDYDVSGFQAIRANWRITRGRTWQLMRLKWRLWFWKTLGVLTFYFGWLAIIYEPYTSAVWTAAYLDIAGSEPPREL